MVVNSGSLGIALDYTLGQGNTPEVFLEDGRMEIDNDLVENAIRPTALGMKNWLSWAMPMPGNVELSIIRRSRSAVTAAWIRTPILKDVLSKLALMTNKQIP